MKLSAPRLLLHLEGLVALLAACALYRLLGASWVKFGMLFLVPDISLLGDAFGKGTGATVYNTGHTYVGPFLLALVGYLGGWPSLLPLCLIWAGHIGFDRLLGFGLKYPDDAKTTHLGKT